MLEAKSLLFELNLFFNKKMTYVDVRLFKDAINNMKNFQIKKFGIFGRDGSVLCNKKNDFKNNYKNGIEDGNDKNYKNNAKNNNDINYNDNDNNNYSNFDKNNNDIDINNTKNINKFDAKLRKNISKTTLSNKSINFGEKMMPEFSDTLNEKISSKILLAGNQLKSFFLKNSCLKEIQKYLKEKNWDGKS